MKIFLHAGYPKAASTTLQKHLFNKHSRINNLGIYPRGNIGIDSEEMDTNALYLNSPELKKLYDNIVKLETVDYSISNTAALYREKIAPLLDEEKVNIFSNERFLTPFFCYSDIGVKAQRAREIFGEIKVIIMLRNQFDLMRSQYADWPCDPRAFTMRRGVGLSEWINIDLAAVDSRNFIKSLNYFLVLKYYSALFGQDNIKILLFEQLRDNVDDFAEEISAFTGIDPAETSEVLRNKHENRARTPDKKREAIDPVLEKKLYGYFSNINRQVQSEFGIDLGKKGYPV